MRKTWLLAVVSLLALALAAPAVTGAHGKHHGHKHVKAKRAKVPARAAGTVTSFDGTTLTITLNSGATVSGTVSDRTVIYKLKVRAKQDIATASTRGGKHRGKHHVKHRGKHRHGWWWKKQRWGWLSRGGADDLTPGTTVWKATLDVDDNGATWKKIKLIVPARAPAPPPNDT